MNIHNLKVGERYKWKTICEKVGIPYVNGNSKIKQMKEFESLCKFTKQGVWFTIEEIYQVQKKIKDGRKDNSIDDLMKSAIMHKVVNTQEGYYCSGVNNWLSEIGIVKDAFVMLNQKYCRSQYENDTEYITPMDRDFITLEYSSLRNHFLNALEKIRKTKLADYFITCRIGYSENKEVQWTRDLTDDEMKFLYKEKDKLYKKYGILNEIDLLYGNKKLGITRNTNEYNNFKSDLRKVLKKNFNANFEYTAYKVILKNTSDLAFKVMEKDFFDGYNLVFLKDSIYIKRRKSAERRQEEAQKKYKIVDGEGKFFDITNQSYINSLNLNEVEKNKINGLYVELWEAIYREMML